MFNKRVIRRDEGIQDPAKREICLRNQICYCHIANQGFQVQRSAMTSPPVTVAFTLGSRTASIPVNPSCDRASGIANREVKPGQIQ